MNQTGAGPDQDAGSRRKRFLWAGLKLAVALAALSVLLRHLASNPMPKLPGPSAFWPAAAGTAVLLAVITLLRVIKWRMIVRAELPRASLGDCARSYLAATPYGLITPGRVGEFMRLAYLPPLPAGPLRGAALVMVDRIIDATSLLWLAAGGLWILVGPWAGICMLACAAMALGLGWWLGFWSKFIAKMPGRWRLSSLAMPGRGMSHSTVLWATLLGALAHAGVAAQYVLMMHLLGAGQPTWPSIAGVMSLVTLINALPISLAGLGVREGCAVLFLRGFGVTAVAAGAGAFLVFIINAGLQTVAGLLVSMWSRDRAGVARGKAVVL